ncbi:MAG: nitroreductase family protein [Candidatus Saccharimonadales bacterium]
MNDTSGLNSNIKNILEIARLAPSVHNTQPWEVTVKDQTIHIKLDPDFTLGDGDPTGRETIISMGIFSEAIIIAAGYLGYKLRSMKFHNQSTDITFQKLQGKPGTAEAVDLLKQRCTDRSIYTPYDVTPEMADTMEKAYAKGDVRIWVRTDPDSLQKTAQLTAQGISLALSSPNFRKELSQYLTEPWSKKGRGIAVDSLYIPRFVAVLEPYLMRLGVGVGAEVKLEKKRWLSASADIYIATRGDMPEYWFKAGRAYLQVSLQIEKLGLSQATSAATVEASNFHEDIEEMLGTNFRLQSVLRVGQGSKNRVHSPRVTTDTLLATSS